MKVKLIKKVEYSNDKEIYYSLIANDKCIGTTHNVFNKEMKDNNENVVFNKLSKQNCDEIFGVVDVEKLAKECAETAHTMDELYENGLFYGFVSGFNKAMELNKDKVFNIGQAKQIYEKACDIGYARGDSLSNDSELMNMDFDDVMKELQQPTEIEVQIVMEEVQEIYRDGTVKWERCPKLDSSGNLILKKI
jgi:hypothetical protein